jgi:hypothetical protein
MIPPEPSIEARYLHDILDEFTCIVGWAWKLEYRIFDPLSAHPSLIGQNRFFYLDLFEVSKRIAIELNGNQHQQEPQLSKDAAKELCCKRLDITLLWYWNRDIRSVHELVENVEAFINMDGTLNERNKRSFFRYEDIVLDALTLYYERSGRSDPRFCARDAIDQRRAIDKVHREAEPVDGPVNALRDFGIDWDSID